MTLTNNYSLPVENPVIIFVIVLLIILISPLVLRRLRIPGIIGLILAGALIGPNGLNILLFDKSIVLFGTVGMLYIMFLAGIEIDMVQFKRSRYRSLFFGLMTFLFPQVIGTFVSYYWLGLSVAPSILLASMFASHTLITYPIVSKLGLTKTEAVTVAIGGTLITNTLSLVILSVVVQFEIDQLSAIFWVFVALSSLTLGFLVFWGIPKLARWFFKSFEGEGSSHFLFVLTIVFLTAFLAQLARLEAIIGAFLAGIALNRLIPGNSPLMSRLEFVGNTLFIPFFLIGVGMLVDFKVLFVSEGAVRVALTMVVVATATKWIAAYITQKFFDYSTSERQIIFGLSNSQAAATLAAVSIGYNLGILDDNVLNGTVIMILVTCFIASLVTESAGRKMVLSGRQHSERKLETLERIMVPVSNPETIQRLIDLAILIKDPQSAEPIYPLTVVKDDENAQDQIVYFNKVLQQRASYAAASGKQLKLVTRVDINIASGIASAIKEMQATTIIVGWNARITTREKIFGSILDHLLHHRTQTFLVSKLVHPINTCRHLRLYVPDLAHYENGFSDWLSLIKTLMIQTGTDLQVNAKRDTLPYLKHGINVIKPSLDADFRELYDIPDYKTIAQSASTNDLFVFVSARRSNISYDSYLDEMPHQLSKYFGPYSFIIIYPDLINRNTFDTALQLDEESSFIYQQNISRLQRLQKRVVTALSRFKKL